MSIWLLSIARDYSFSEEKIRMVSPYQIYGLSMFVGFSRLSISPSKKLKGNGSSSKIVETLLYQWSPLFCLPKEISSSYVEMKVMEFTRLGAIVSVKRYLP